MADRTTLNYLPTPDFCITIFILTTDFSNSLELALRYYYYYFMGLQTYNVVLQ